MGSPLALKVTADHSGQPFEMWEKKKKKDRLQSQSILDFCHIGLLRHLQES